MISMLRISLKTALRHLSKEKFFTLMNLVGLAVAISASLFIMGFVMTEKSFDSHVPNLSNKYRLTLDISRKGDIQKYATNFYTVAPILNEVLPEVKSINRFYYLDRHAIVTVEDEKFNEMNVLFADLNFFQFFDMPIVIGAESDLVDGAYLSEEMVKKYFGSDEAIGQLLKINTEDGEHLFKVTGVFRKGAKPSHLNPQIILPIDRLIEKPLYQKFNWTWNFFGTYLEIEDGTDPQELIAKINQTMSTYYPDRLQQFDPIASLQPLSEIHLNPDLTYEYAEVASGLITHYLFYASLFILVLAYINYLNISNARNTLRVKEIGVRKVLGSKKYHIISQLLCEALLVNLGAIILSLTLIQLLLPLFQFLGLDLSIPLVSIKELLPIMFALLFVGTITAGLFPALLMSGIKAKEAINREVKTAKSGLNLRRLMVMGQFAITTVMIASVMVMRSQLSFMINKEKGIELEQVVVINGPRASEATGNTQAFKSLINELNQITGVSHASVSTSVPGIWMGNSTIASLEASMDDIPAQAYGASSDYFNCYGISLEAGRVFSEVPADEESVLINLASLHQLGYNTPNEIIDQRVKVGSSEKRVIGVVSDYHHFDLREPVYPTVILPFRRNPEYFSIKLMSSVDQQILMERVEALWNQYYPSDPFDFFYQDKMFQQAHAFESKVVQSFSLFTLLAVLIAILGIVGLATFVTNRKVKEIGIRKVLGAGVGSVLYLLIKDFIFLIAVGLVVGAPIIYFSMTHWLDNYAFRIEFPWWIVPTSGVLLMIVTLLTVSYQTIRTALADPVNSLRYE